MKIDNNLKLQDILKDGFRRKRLLMFRGEEELEFLREWLNSSDEIAVEPEETPPESEFSLKGMVEKCSKCGEVSEKKFGFGDGSNRVMIILNAPRLVDKIEKKLYRNDSIALLKKIVHAIGLDFNKCYVTNLVKCETSDSLMKPSQMVINCLPLAEKEIGFLKPGIVIVMGEMQSLQKIIHKSSGTFWFNIEHPITLIKNPELKKSAWITLKDVIKKSKELGLV